MEKEKIWLNQDVPLELVSSTTAKDGKYEICAFSRKSAIKYTLRYLYLCCMPNPVSNLPTGGTEY